MKRAATAMLLALSITGCAGMQANPGTERLAVQFATLKVIEQSEGVTADGIVEHVERVRAIVEGNPEVSLQRLVEQVRGPIEWERLAPSDQLLLDALIAQIEYSAQDVTSDYAGDERRVRIMTLLDWVEAACTLSSSPTS